MNRSSRIALAIFLPAPIGTFLLSLIYFLGHNGSFRPEAITHMIVWAYIAVGIQSIFYSLSMELWLQKNITNNYLFISISTFLGGISELVFIYPLEGRVGISFMYIGLLTGFIIGIILRILYLYSPRPAGFRTQAAT